MHKALSILTVILAGLAGISVYPHSAVNGVLAGVVIFLLIEFFSLRRRIGILEAEHRQGIQAKVPEDRAAENSPFLKLAMEVTEEQPEATQT